MAATMQQDCPVCGGTGWRITNRDGRELAVPCECRLGAASVSVLRRTRIPPRYTQCTLDSFELWDPTNPRLGQVQKYAREFVAAYPAVARGLLFMGRVGCGKTHLAVGVLRELVQSKGVNGLFVNFLELVLALQMSFDGGGRSKESILSPVTDTELVVLDDLGAGKLTPWVMDLLYHVVNSRYMHRRMTLVTTNYTDWAAPESGEESLADRVSVRVRSRLHEMCDLLDIRSNADYRSRQALQRR